MALSKLIQIKVSQELYMELVRESIMSGLNLSQICRLKLSNKKIIDKNELKSENHPKFRPVGISRS